MITNYYIFCVYLLQLFLSCCFVFQNSVILFYSSIFKYADSFSVPIYDNAHFIACILWSKIIQRFCITVDLSVKEDNHSKSFRQDWKTSEGNTYICIPFQVFSYTVGLECLRKKKKLFSLGKWGIFGRMLSGSCFLPPFSLVFLSVSFYTCISINQVTCALINFCLKD